MRDRESVRVSERLTGCETKELKRDIRDIRDKTPWSLSSMVECASTQDLALKTSETCTSILKTPIQSVDQSIFTSRSIAESMWFLGLARHMSQLEDLGGVALFKVVPEKIGLGLDAQIGFSRCRAVCLFCFLSAYRVVDSARKASELLV